MNEVEYIKDRLEETERLLGLTEEALELALAALKLRRVLDGRNPTPVTEEQATENLLEEYGDVLNSIEVLITPTQNERAMQSRTEKRSRWVSRLQAADFEQAGVQYRQHHCPECGWTWLEDCDASDYPDYCPHCRADLHMAEQTPGSEGCEFCRSFDFGSARCVVDQHGASIAFAGGSSRYPNEEQFRFCPYCGARRHGGGTVTEPEERKGGTGY